MTGLLGLSAVTAGVILFLGGFLKSPVQPTRPPLSEPELRAVAETLRLPEAPKSQAENREITKALLGQRIFFDAGFSQNGKVSCATCHNPDRSFTDGRIKASGLSETQMNTPTLLFAKQGNWFFYDGRADSLAAQALGPIENSLEHGFTRRKVLSRLRSHYRSEYEAVFGPLPLSGDVNLTAKRTPAPKVSDAVAAYALSTLGSTSMLNSILSKAQSRSTQPVYILQEIAANDFAVEAVDLKDSETRETNEVFANFGRSLAAFEETIRTGAAPFDRFAAGLVNQDVPEAAFVPGFSSEEYAGLKLFVGEANCVLCHNGPQLTDQQFHNIGLPSIDEGKLELGRAQGILVARANPFNCQGSLLIEGRDTESCREMEFAETEQSEWVGAFKTPTLRNIAVTAPYGHDGRFPGLDEILEHYDKVSGQPAVGHREESLMPLNLSETEKSQLKAFLNSLTGAVQFGVPAGD